MYRLFLRGPKVPTIDLLNWGRVSGGSNMLQRPLEITIRKTSFKKNNPNMLLLAMEYTDMNTDHKHGIILEIAVKSEEQRPSKIKVFEPW